MVSKYVKKDPISHILDRPDMYVGSMRPQWVEEYVVIDNRIEKKKIHFSPAILRIFIEPLSNAIDNVARSKAGKNKVTYIRVSIDRHTGETTVQNDGEIVPIEIHPEEKCYNHSLIFGQLLTGSNYDDEEERLDISGKNGLGIKVVSVFSTCFTVEGVDPQNKKLFRQTWKNNLKETESPLILDKVGKGYTKVVYIPDFKRFNLQNYSNDIISLYKKYVFDTAMITKVDVYWNDERIPVNSLQEYAKLYSNGEDSLMIKTKDCEVVVTPSDEFQAISFANGVYTPLGGTHVDAWSEAIFRPIIKKLNKPKKPVINIKELRQYFRLFIVATVSKPGFDSQNKARLESPVVYAIVKKSHIDTICKWAVMERIEEIIRAKEMIVMKKTERKKRGHEKVDGLDPANNEGGPKSRDCTLILVEGLSAKTYAIWGIQRGVFGKEGRDWNGILALGGKILNTRNSTPAIISKNTVISNIIKALGLQYNVDYNSEENFCKLRYGRVLSITDSDCDGIHINCLIHNLFHSLFQSLLQREKSFLTSMQTPVVCVYVDGLGRFFYDDGEYKKYVIEFYRKFPDKKIHKKYYKGLGASDEQDVKNTFGKKIIQFHLDDSTSDNMNKAFHNKHSDQRKEWLEKYNPENTILKWNGNTEESIHMTFSDYIDTELIKFSIDDCKRSIPSLIDGLKESHRKVLYVCILRNLKYSGKTLKVFQLVGSVAEKSGYHHGEQNLCKTITGMANCYVGCNNIPLLYRDGQYGTREVNGKDASNARYILTKLDMLTRFIFKPEDDVLLDYIEDDGEKVEPRFYVPIIPMILVNGCTTGIGTGWSSNIPCYNPIELINSVRSWLKNEKIHPLTPWYKGFTGTIEKVGDQQYVSWGKIEKNHVTELPIGLWTADFKQRLEQFKENKIIANYKNRSTPDKISFTIINSKNGIRCDEKNLKLFTYIRTSNMVLFTEQGHLKRFRTVEEIIDAFCTVRYAYYTRRKAYLLHKLERDVKILENKRRFLQEVRDGVIKLFETVGHSRKTCDIVSELENRKYDKNMGVDSDEDEEKKSGYEYLLRLQINSITEEKINKLEQDIFSRISERDALNSATETHLWLSDLEILENKL